MTVRKHTVAATLSATLALVAIDYASVARAAAVRGTKETITFEIVRKKQAKPIPNGYDSFNWSNFEVLGKDQMSGGAAKVVYGKAAAIVLDQKGDSYGVMSPVSGTFWLKSGHFAAVCTGPTDATFSAYRRGVLIGQLTVTLQPADTKLQFDRTFSHADQVLMQGSSEGCSSNIAMDNLEVVLQ
jgi:hypothetical protein